MTTEIFGTLDNFFTCYLTRRDLEATLNCVSDEIISLGTGAQERLRREAGLDPLTQILNRREGIRLIEYAISRKQYGILMVIDIDNVNPPRLSQELRRGFPCFRQRIRCRS
jgi:PleD family two-component response regulator